MSYQSVDALQQVLVEKVFHYAADRKKAAGRALGTLVEIITYYALKSWHFRENVAIERALPEYKNPAITHNVEFSLHPVLQRQIIPLQEFTLPLTTAKLRRALDAQKFARGDLAAEPAQVLSNDGVLRNACIFGESPDAFCIASVDEMKGNQCALTVSVLSQHPFAIFECKRVGVEEGMKKGPQSIEKAKQGAYVARSVSALQKVRYANGQIGGVIQLADGTLYHEPYGQLLEETIKSNDPAMLRDFILTVGVVSNHGNWFTGDDHNKELKVLAQSYDWLQFLTDQGLAEFVSELLLHPTPELADARKAFLQSYGPKASANRFTKVKMDVKADMVLRHYFATHARKMESWFNIITPNGQGLKKLQEELKTLNGKDWTKMLSK
ncbi:MAG: hypothetical protein KGJ60_04330 [Verrucomicrobiota bacterium]|nr:hypothetical protein [Verrucomicrobiota bacterium]